MEILCHWLEQHGDTKTSSGQVQMNYIWGPSIVETCSPMMIVLWEIRNEEVHGKEEEATKQQKRKAKAAISVRALHKLQDQVCPSDSFLFYPDMEEEIKHAINSS